MENKFKGKALNLIRSQRKFNENKTVSGLDFKES
jgi:hypothetical protein